MVKNDIKNSLKNIENKINKLLLQGVENTCNYSLYAWLDDWLVISKPPTLSAKWLANLRCNIKRLKTILQDKLLNEYTAQELLQVLYTIPMSYTQSACYNLLRNAFDEAVKLGYILSSPLDGATDIKHHRKRGKALTVDEQRHFLTLLQDNPRKPLYLFYLLTGCRCSEALSLRWQDIDYNAKQIHICGTKTQNANRYIPLFPELVVLLDEIPRNSDKVFNLTYYAVKSHFQRLKRKYGLTFRLHDLRHTFATRCIECGISVFTLSKWLGLSNISVTANIYTHVLTDFEKQEIAKFKPII